MHKEDPDLASTKRWEGIGRPRQGDDSKQTPTASQHRGGHPSAPRDVRSEGIVWTANVHAAKVVAPSQRPASGIRGDGSHGLPGPRPGKRAGTLWRCVAA